uniref:Uncharacterized protein n=1 Tax=Lepeophtheirus salmonis TaxID=72036 RepID=A0A0K2TFT3_LEPSM
MALLDQRRIFQCEDLQLKKFIWFEFNIEERHLFKDLNFDSASQILTSFSFNFFFNSFISTSYTPSWI